MLFTKLVRQKVTPYWEGSFQHPFIQELESDNLVPEIFRYYLIQDQYYLSHFSRLHFLIAQQTTDKAVADLMVAEAKGLASGELAVRRDFFKQLAITDKEVAQTPVAPTAYHYVSHMYRQLIDGTSNTAFAAALPCSWLYHEIGVRLNQHGSPDPLYQQWIATYADKTAAAQLQQACRVINRLYQKSSVAEQQAMVQALCISSQLEYAFWQMAYTFERWPKGAANGSPKHVRQR
ncbi:thiaminase II [Loigolactobacillus rennini]|uniref:Aminopyrimidine aminohydrolase n=1 Tax=Loigolactobacillus rennini DSM 20253 TaxID=1423796 RepID=A0A0R2D666_9LACO|nr:thiaminase II [Loigolactobacillus rennini]KRM99373.1 tenA protein [Loigolactobacillus rennini DSM 20253]